MTNDEFFRLKTFKSCGVVSLKPGQPHAEYVGPVRVEKNGPESRFWFLYQNTARQCRWVGGDQSGVSRFEEC